MKQFLRKFPTAFAMARFARRAGLSRLHEMLPFRHVLRLRQQGRVVDAFQRLRTLTEGRRDIPPILSEVAYTTYDAYIRHGHAVAHTFAEFERYGLYQSCMPAVLLARLMAELDAAPTGPQTADDYAPNYYASYDPNVALRVEDVHSFVRLSPEQRARVSAIFTELAAPVGRCLGLPARVINFKGWWTTAKESDIGMNSWHTDGMPEEICKLMVYPFGASMTAGTTEFRRADGSTRCVDGPPGVYAIFKNSSVVHRGIGPRTGKRLVFELTLAPHWEDDWLLANGGSVGSYPTLPWAELPR